MRPSDAQRSSFKERMFQSSQDRSSRVILAVDLNEASQKALLNEAFRLVKSTARFLCAVKFGRATVLNLGNRGTSSLVGLVHDYGMPCIIDDKLNDIDEINQAITSAYFRLGFDAIIVNPFAGWKGALEPVFRLAHEQDRGVIVLVYMSHPDASSSYGQSVLRKTGAVGKQYIVFAEAAVKWKADGAVVGATRPTVVKEVDRVLRKRIPIYSPGIGTQGGTIRAASSAGTYYFIIGRSITKSRAPSKLAAKYASMSTAP
ncbi:MAG: hypothetical protein AUJ07_10770 [Crenarchaeota archaeon 13_1_40CM_3_53_5]|nr:MAG: hypothetical protein AUJ07_10770 [Crenarchaeota archaeon 13_1_40CM_3_53_5]